MLCMVRIVIGRVGRGRSSGRGRSGKSSSSSRFGGSRPTHPTHLTYPTHMTLQVLNAATQVEARERGDRLAVVQEVEPDMRITAHAALRRLLRDDDLCAVEHELEVNDGVAISGMRKLPVVRED